MAAVGLALAVTFGIPIMAIIGFTIVGLGFSCIVPVLFSAAAKVQGIAPGTAIAAVAGISYAGFMAGPPFIGFIADEFNLSVGLGSVVLLSVVSIGIARFIRL